MEKEILTEYEIKLKIAKDYMSGFGDGKLSYNNSSHRSIAVHKFQIALTQGEKDNVPFPELEYIRNKIHFLQTA